MVSRRKVLGWTLAGGSVAYLANTNPLVPEPGNEGQGPGSDYVGPIPRGESIGTYPDAVLPHAAVTSHAGKVNVFVVVIDPTNPAGAWVAVPPSGSPATVTLPGDGSLIVTWGTAGTSSYGQHGFAATIWQEWTVNENELPPPPPTTTTTTTTIPPTTSTSS